MTKKERDHGYYLYSKKGCRCETCRAANTEHHRKARAERYERTRLNNDLAPVAKHGLKTAQNWGCKCPTCRSSVREMNVGNRDIYRETFRRASARNTKRRQAATSERASRNGYEWTGAEMELVTRDDIPLQELAFSLSRSYAAVATMRARIQRGEPKLMRVLGVQS